MNFDCDCGKFIAKSISNEGKLILSKCKITKSGYNGFRAELGDKQVINYRKMFKKLFIGNNYLETVLMYENF